MIWNFKRAVGRVAAWMILALILSGAACVQAQQKNEIHIEPARLLDHSFQTFQKHLFVEGKIKGDLFCFGGKTLIKGTVEGNVTIAFGQLELTPSAMITGRIITVKSPYVGPQMEKGKLVELRLPDPFYPRLHRPMEYLKRSLARILMGFLLVVALLILKPRLVREAGLEIRVDWMPSFFVGAMFLLLFATGLFSALLMLAHPLGLYVFILLSLILIVVVIFGLAAIYEAWASILYRRLSFKGSFVHALLLAVFSLEVICLLPYIGTLTQLVIVILGIGSTVSTRFGTNRGWFTQNKKVWPS